MNKTIEVGFFNWTASDEDVDENEDEDDNQDALSLVHRIDILRKVLRFTQDYTLPRGYSIKDKQHIIK